MGSLAERREQVLARLLVRRRHHARLARVALLLSGFRGEDVAAVTAGALHAAASPHPEALGGAPLGLHLRHRSLPRVNRSPIARQGVDVTWARPSSTCCGLRAAASLPASRRPRSSTLRARASLCPSRGA